MGELVNVTRGEIFVCILAGVWYNKDEVFECFKFGFIERLNDPLTRLRRELPRRGSL